MEARTRTFQDQSLTLQEAADLSAGKLCYWSLYRWATSGLRGVVLESWFIGGKRYTSMEAIDRFNEAQTRMRGGATASKPSHRKRRPSARDELRKVHRVGLRSTRSK